MSWIGNFLWGKRPPSGPAERWVRPTASGIQRNEYIVTSCPECFRETGFGHHWSCSRRNGLTTKEIDEILHCDADARYTALLNVTVGTLGTRPKEKPMASTLTFMDTLGRSYTAKAVEGKHGTLVRVTAPCGTNQTFTVGTFGTLANLRPAAEGFIVWFDDDNLGCGPFPLNGRWTELSWNDGNLYGKRVDVQYPADGSLKVLCSKKCFVKAVPA